MFLDVFVELGVVIARLARLSRLFLAKSIFRARARGDALSRTRTRGDARRARGKRDRARARPSQRQGRGATPRRDPAPAPPRRRNPRKYAVTKKMKQKDRIADDYYELLRNVA